jgi:hypothetical protein
MLYVVEMEGFSNGRQNIDPEDSSLEQTLA